MYSQQRRGKCPKSLRSLISLSAAALELYQHNINLHLPQPKPLPGITLLQVFQLGFFVQLTSLNLILFM